jgi:tetratricopeptide (TPR) repeat protein
MGEDSPIRTATMARIYAEQGHYQEAAEIYRYLLQRDPRRKDLAEALVDAEAKALETGVGSRGDLVALFSEWIRLLLQMRQLRSLEELQRKLSSSRSSE